MKKYLEKPYVIFEMKSLARAKPAEPKDLPTPFEGQEIRDLKSLSSFQTLRQRGPLGPAYHFGPTYRSTRYLR